MAKKLIIANWKMNPLDLKEAELLFKEEIKGAKEIKKAEIIICPPFIYLEVFRRVLKTKKFKVNLGAQDAFFEDQGAYTGQVSSAMLKNFNVKYLILGHSEKRALGETSEIVNKKIRQALVNKITPILCVGDLERDENHEYFNFIKNQLEESLDGISRELLPSIIIAYEPVWALSTTASRRDESPEDFQELSIFIKKILTDKFGAKTKMPRIIYGGSVNEKNALEFLKVGEGVLVGGASLHSEKFLEIIKIVELVL